VCNAALTGRTYRHFMDTDAKLGPTRAGADMTTANLASRGSRGAGGTLGHVCAVPGYLQLPDLAMFWQCLDCGEMWQVVAARSSPGAALEFVWVRDAFQLLGSQAM